MSATGQNLRLPHRSIGIRFTPDSGHPPAPWMGRLWVPRTGWFAPSACRVSRGGACLERVQDRPDLHMRPHPAASSTHAPLIELGSTLVVAPGTGAHDLLNCRANIAGKPPRIGLQAATPGISWARMPLARAETEYHIVCGLRLAQSPPFRLLIARARQHSVCRPGRKTPQARR